MDPFTQRLMERTKKRREVLDQYMSKDTDIVQRSPLHESNHPNYINHEEIRKKENIKQPIQTQVPESENTENISYKEDAVHEDIKQYSNDDLEFKSDERRKPCKFGRLAQLASKIKEWEDELDKPKHSSQPAEKSKANNKKAWAPKPAANKTVKPAAEEKQESQGYSLSQNESRLIYSFEKEKEKEDSSSRREVISPSKAILSPNKRSDAECGIVKEVPPKKPCGNSPRVNSEVNRDSAVLKKAAFFESHSKSSPAKSERDPVELSIAERKALFEKNGGEALLPKVAFSTPLPAKMINATKKAPAVAPVEIDISKRSKRLVQPERKPEGAENPQVPAGSEVESKVKLQKEKFEKGMNPPRNDGESPRKTNADVLMREKELEMLKNRWDRNKSLAEEERSNIPKPPPMPSPGELSAVRSPRACEIVTSPPKTESSVKEVDCLKEDGRLYPSLSDLEKSDSSDQLSGAEAVLNESRNSNNLYLNMTFSDILEAKKNDPTSSNDNSFNSELRESRVLSKMDEFLDNAFNDLSSTDSYDSDNETAPSPPKMMKSSSFEFKERGGGEDERRRGEGGGAESPVNPLVHTISFYRKQQQNSMNNQTPTPVKSVKREEVIAEDVAVEEEEVLVENKIQELLQEINKQQIIISQASQALNLCLSTVEFSGSGEQVESERLLLLSNHKRQACLNEIQRLKVENTIRPLGSNQQLAERGDVVINNIAIPFKREAVRAMAAVESMQYLVCLIKSDERVIATPAVPATRDNLKNLVLCFPGQYKLENLLSDFKVTIEVYNLELNKEMLPHEVKYHIGHKKDKKLLTPIKSKKSESRLIMPHVQSPAGPNAVRSSNFHLCGYIVFSLREISRTNWTLNKVPYTSPLEGTFSMKIQSQLQLDMEFRGFLTMFDDISGFGAWHRRWCLLSSHTLSYWKYPDDETRKIPVGSIDLRGVVTENVGLVSRDICARLYTFLLETTRPRREDDVESLVLHTEGDVTRIRHLLSADSKEEMLVWCRKINLILALLRSWRCTLGD